EIPSVEGHVGQTRVHYLLDHTDDPVIPRRGVSMESNFRWFDASPGAKDGFPSMDLKVGYFQPVARSASIYFESEGGSTFGETNTGIPQFFLGAPLRLSAYGQNEFQGNQYYLLDRKSTRLNSSHGSISYAVFCLKKKNRFTRKHTESRETSRLPRCTPDSYARI